MDTIRHSDHPSKFQYLILNKVFIFLLILKLLICWGLAVIAACITVFLKWTLKFLQVNYNLMTVNVFMALSGFYQLGRKLKNDMEKKA